MKNFGSNVNVRRYTVRDEQYNGGDDWIFRSGTEVISELARRFPTLLFGDGADMNGGEFPPHSISNHGNNDAVDVTSPDIKLKNQDAAKLIVEILNVPYFAERIKRIGTTYNRNTPI